MKNRFLLVSAFLTLAVVFAEAQVINPKKVVKKKTESKVNQVIEKKAGEVVDSAFGQNSQPKKNDNLSTKKEGDNIGRNAADTTKLPTDQSQPPLQTYSKFDFIPGEKVILFDDFSADKIGDFPALWNTNGSGEVVTTNLFPGNWLKFETRNAIWTDNLLKLPDNYTIEFDVIATKDAGGRMQGYIFRLMQAINEKSWDAGSVPGKAGLRFNIEYTGRPTYSTYINGEEGRGLGLSGYINEPQYKQVANQKYHISIWVQKGRLRLYQNENKLIDLPKAFPLPSVKLDRIRFEYGSGMISNIRIAAGLPDMRNKLLTEGKIVSYGIYFDVNKDVVKAESYGSLKEIASILNEVPDVKILVVGHTDADGTDASNLDLSKRRAAAVKAELIKTFGVDASRIQTDGKGESQAVASNDSPSNKALNRRVEFIKQ
ncbi:MAG: OmpA family protein [Flavisolibacter sp.]